MNVYDLHVKCVECDTDLLLLHPSQITNCLLLLVGPLKRVFFQSLLKQFQSFILILPHLYYHLLTAEAEACPAMYVCGTVQMVLIKRTGCMIKVFQAYICFINVLYLFLGSNKTYPSAITKTPARNGTVQTTRTQTSAVGKVLEFTVLMCLVFVSLF